MFPKRSPPISRILSRTIIYLGCMSPCTSCGLPTASFAHRAGGTGGLLGFAPGGVCRAVIVTNDAVRSYRTLSPLPSSASARVGGLLSVALSVALPRPAVNWRPALWSSDFPRCAQSAPRSSGGLRNQFPDEALKVTFWVTFLLSRTRGWRMSFSSIKPILFSLIRLNTS